MTKPLISTVFLIALVSVSFAKGRGPSPVIVGKVEKVKTSQHKRISGRVVARQISELSPQSSGHVKTILVQEGDWVKKGQVLLSLDDESTLLKIKEIETEVTVKLAQKNRTQNVLQYQEYELQDLNNAERSLRGSVAKKDIRTENSKKVQLLGDLKQIDAEIAVLNQRLAQEKLRLKQHKLVAPFDGQILKRHVQLGQWFNLGQSAFQLIDPNAKEVELDIPDTYFSQLNLSKDTVLSGSMAGMKQRIQLLNPRIKQVVNPKTKTFILITTPKDKKSIIQGMTVDVQLPIQTDQETLMITYNAILKNDTGNFVYKVIPGAKGHMVLPVAVKLGFRQGNRVSILSPAIQAGDQLVIEGGERLFPMTPVLPQEAKK